MSPSQVRTLFTVSVIFNFVVAALLLLAPALFLQLFQITPGITQRLWIQEFGVLVLAFGIGYYWISRDPAGNRNLIQLGIIAKSFVVLVGLWNVFTGQVSWQFMIPASADGIFAVLFYQALQPLRQGEAQN